MNFLQRAVLALAALAWAPLAQAHDFGPPAGATSPAIAAHDQADAERDFASLKGERGLVLVFTRSADWCPFCQAQLIGLEGVRAEIEQRGWRLAGVTTDTVEKNAAFAARRRIAYPILADPQFQLVDAFDLRDPAYPPGHRVHGVPAPTIFFITPDQTIAARLSEDSYRVRPAPESVLATLDRLNAR